MGDSRDPGSTSGSDGSGMEAVARPDAASVRERYRDEITYPFQNFNGAVIEVWGWINNFNDVLDLF